MLKIRFNGGSRGYHRAWIKRALPYTTNITSCSLQQARWLFSPTCSASNNTPCSKDKHCRWEFWNSGYLKWISEQWKWTCEGTIGICHWGICSGLSPEWNDVIAFPFKNWAQHYNRTYVLAAAMLWLVCPSPNPPSNTSNNDRCLSRGGIRVYEPHKNTNKKVLSALSWIGILYRWLQFCKEPWREGLFILWIKNGVQIMWLF